MLHYILSLVSLVALTQAAPPDPPALFKCNQNWGPVPYTVPGNCFSVGAGTEIAPTGGYTYDIMATETLYANSPWVLEAAKNIQEAVELSVKKYTALEAQLSPFHFIFVDSDTGKLGISGALADSYRPNLDGPCQIRIFNMYKIMTPEVQKQAIAHELFHCIQQTMIPDRAPEASNWWSEGSASYFMNWVYPTGNFEWKFNKEFRLDTSIYKHAYAAEQYFQALEMRKGVYGIFEWVIRQRFTDTLPEERTRLSLDAIFTEDYHYFAKQYSDGFILDTDTFQKAVEQKSIPREVMLKGNREVKVTFGTFKIRNFKLDVVPGRTIRLYYSSKWANVRASYKITENSRWIKMAGSLFHGNEGLIELPCNDGKLMSLVILLSSTDDVDLADVTLTVNEEKKNDSCKCPKTKRKRQVDPGEDTVQITDSESKPEEEEEDKCEDKPEGWGSCTDSTLPVDPCFLNKKWQIDPAITSKLLREEFQKINLGTEGFSLNSVSISGFAGISLAKNTVMEFKDYTVDISMTIAEQAVPVKTVINGRAEAVLNMLSGGNGKGTFCLRVTKGEGKAVGTNPLVGGIEFDLGQGFIEQRMSIEYTCSERSLNMGGNVDGVQWGPYSYIA